MNVLNTECPAASVLSDFGLGKLDAASADTVCRHLEMCADCRQRVANISGDSFVGRLRQAEGAAKPAVCRERTFVPGESLANAASSTDGSSAKEDGLPRPSRSVADDKLQDGLGSPSSVSAPPELTNHPDYGLIKELGQGGMGTVYLAKNRMMDRMEVLKVISKELLARPGALERFQQEIRSAAKLAHPNIVAAYSVLRPGDLLVFAMEYVKGQDLSQVVKQRGPLPVANAAFYIHQVALGLQHAHEKGMVHRDIKPNNLMLAIEGKKHTVKILDFGLAKASSEKGAETGLTKSGQMLGTPDYVAPEQTLDAHNADIRADIYSLGCTLYFLLSGGPPFQEQSLYEILEAHHKREPKPLNLVRPDVPVELATVVAKMMAKDPTKRYQTPIEVAKALVPFFKPGHNAATSPPADATQLPNTGDTAHGLGAAMPISPPTPFPTPVVAHPVAMAVPLPAAEPTGQFDLSIDSRRAWAHPRTWWPSLPPWQQKAVVLAAGAGAVLLLGIVLLARTQSGGFVSLFNGKDLTGWKKHQGGGSWRVENGILTGSGEANSYLVTERATFTNFHLRVEARINDRGESGVYFRATPGKQLWPKGFEAQINTSDKSEHGDSDVKTGALFGWGGDGCIARVTDSPVHPNEWFILEIIASGNHIVVKVNGKTTADHIDARRRFLTGHIALEKYRPQTVVEFRKIEIKELRPATNGRPSGSLDAAPHVEQSTGPATKPQDRQPAESTTADEGAPSDGETRGESVGVDPAPKGDRGTARTSDRAQIIAGDPGEEKLQEFIQNPTFAEGLLSGWNLEGGASGFRVFLTKNGQSALTTFGQYKDQTMGRVYQQFRVPQNAIELKLDVHGRNLANLYVALKQGEKRHFKVTGHNSNEWKQVTWNLQELRGKPVTLEIVDHAPDGYIGVKGFHIVVGDPAPN